ncbi:MAG: prolipoprotein diacylglyceryl transferase, partial [Propionibacteriales bacterium]|nr:prolipoprotein diacylglyceryl transferase [Propionibacteriales bacterium]
GMAVGRIGCLLTELPGTPTGGWGVTLSPEEAARLDGPAGVTLHLSFGYEIAFHLVAFAVLWGWLRHQPIASGETLTLYLAAYGIFRFLVEFVRGNEVVFASLTRPQLFLLLTVPLILIRVAYQFRHGAYDVRREEGSPVSDSDLPPPRPLSPPSDERGPARARRRPTQARHPSGHRSRPRGTYALTRGCAVRSADHKEWL